MNEHLGMSYATEKLLRYVAANATAIRVPNVTMKTTVKALMSLEGCGMTFSCISRRA